MSRQYTGDPYALLASETDPWLQHPDGTVVDLEPYTALLSPGPCGEDCSGGFFAPTGNGPTVQGVERCDQCGTHAGDLAAAVALAALIGPDVTVWYEPDEEERGCDGDHVERPHQYWYGDGRFMSPVCQRGGCNVMGTGDRCGDGECEGS